MAEIFPTEKPYLDKNGRWYLPSDIQFLQRNMTPREWLALVYYSTNKELCSNKKVLEGFKRYFLGASRSTAWRIKKSLKEKGYL